MRIERGEAAFLAMESDWTRLAEEATSTPCHQWAWLRNWWDVFGSPGKPLVLRVHTDDRLVALAPYYVRSRRTWGLRRLLPMGYNGRLEPFGLTEEPMILVVDGFATQAAEAIANALAARVRAGEADCFVMKVPGAEVTDRLKLRGVVSRVKVRAGSNVAEMAETWTAFRKGLSKSMRDNLPYYPKLLNRGGHAWEVRVERDPAGVPAAVDSLVQLHRMRAWGDAGAAHDEYLSEESHTNFLVRVHEALLPIGGAFLATLFIDGDAVAAQSYLEWAGTLLVLYSGFDPKWSRFSPLLVLQSQVFKDGIERGTRRLNLLGGNAPWQKRWGAAPAGTQLHLIAVSQRPLAIVAAGFYLAAREIKMALRRSGIRRRWTIARRGHSIGKSAGGVTCGGATEGKATRA